MYTFDEGKAFPPVECILGESVVVLGFKVAEQLSCWRFHRASRVLSDRIICMCVCVHTHMHIIRTALVCLFLLHYEH